MSQWVASNILIQPSLAVQCKAAQRFIIIAQCLEELSNYNALMEILGGLQLWAVQRLIKLWGMPKKYHILLLHLSEVIMSPKENYGRYRKTIMGHCKSKTPVLPYLGLFLKDLTFIEDGNPDTLDKKINFQKVAMIGKKLREIKNFQQNEYKISGKITPLLKHLAITPHWSEEELNQRSTKIRPMKTDIDVSSSDSMNSDSAESNPSEDSSSEVSDMVDFQGSDSYSNSDNVRIILEALNNS